MKVEWPSWVRSSRKPPPPRLPAMGCTTAERKAGGHGGVDRVAALAQNFKAGVGGKMVHADDHAVPRAHRLLVAIGNHVLRALLDAVVGGDKKRN